MERLGRYEILAQLGRGAMGTVYRARDPKIDRMVAIKTIALYGISPADETEYRKRFFREAQAAGKLSHAGIVTIHDVGEEEGTQTPYIVMEYIPGKTLESLTAEAPDHRLSVELALGLAKQITEALAYAHLQGIVHRDIKPANIIVTDDGRAKITDFGIAKLAMTQFTLPGEMLGTPSYMAPEQVSGGTVDGRSDLFSLGVMLYLLLTGKKPFTGDTTTAVTFNIAYRDPIPATQVNPSLDPEFDYVLARALAKDPTQRYQSGKEFAADLDDLRQERPARSRSTAAAVAVPRADEAADRTIVRKPIEPAPIAVPAIRLPFRWNSILAFVKGLPREARVGIALGVLLLVFFAFRSTGPSQTASLHIKCQHTFRSAELSVWVDDDLVYEGKLVGTTKTRLGVFERVQGSFAETVRIPAGKVVVRVTVSSPDEGYEQTKEIRGEFLQDGEKTLQISFGKRSRDLYLDWY